MTRRTDHNQTFGPDGRLLAEEVVDVVEYPSREESAALAARLSVVDKVRADELDDDTISQLVGIFPAWAVGIDVAVGEVYAWDGTLVECIQAHTTQADWTPDVTPSLWKIHRTDSGNGPIAWIPGITVEVGEQVIYNDQTYNVLQGHTTQEGWEPDVSPALFESA